MTSTTPSAIVLRSTVLLLVVAVSGCVHIGDMGNVRESGEFSDTLELTGPVDVQVETGAGRIFVDIGDSDRVEVLARVEASGWTSEEAFERLDAVIEDPPISRSAGLIRIGGGGREYRNVWISYEIRVPEDTAIRATTGSGGIEIRGVQDEVEARTGSGRISLESIGGLARAQTGSGRIDARDLAAGFRGGTGSGSVTLMLIAPGDVEVHTGSGQIEIEGVDGALRASSGSGSIEITGVPSDRWEVSAGSGRIRLEVPEDSSFALDAHTPSGGIEVAPEFNLDTVDVDQDERRTRRLRGTVGDGGPLVDVRTNAGGIRILPAR